MKKINCSSITALYASLCQNLLLCSLFNQKFILPYNFYKTKEFQCNNK